MRTESERTISYKPAEQLTVKFHIEEFVRLMRREQEEGPIWSEAVSVRHTFWKLMVYSNVYDRQGGRGSISVQIDGSSNSCSRIYLISESNGTVEAGRDYVGRTWAEWNHDQVRGALHTDGSLVVAADIDLLAPDDSGAKAISGSVIRGYENQQRLVSKLSQLYGDEASSDCVIKIGDVKIPAHKSFLMACSPAFYTMFTSQSAESKSGVVEIQDFKEPEVRAVVRYCYQGHLDDATMDEKLAAEIFKLADKYLIDDLKALMETHFIDKLSVGNVVSMAVYADTHSAPKLKEACHKLIAREYETVFESTAWKELRGDNLELCADLAVAAFRALNKKG